MALYDPDTLPAAEAAPALPVLDFRVHAPLILRAVEQQTLQCYLDNEEQRADGKCAYSGPCAVGIVIPPALRAQLDVQSYPGESTVVTDLFARGALQCVRGQQDDWFQLQSTHDAACLAQMGGEDVESCRADLEHEVRALVAKYATP